MHLELESTLQLMALILRQTWCKQALKIRILKIYLNI